MKRRHEPVASNKQSGRHIWSDDEIQLVMTRAAQGDPPTVISKDWLPHLSPAQVSSKMSALRKAGNMQTTTKDIGVNKERGILKYIKILYII